ncbi:DNA methyltransferase [Microbacterium sp. A93]|uniref:DNA methyltransferase n=1 Tax=Microbacterium sp. A93 TaxID=3450716 RepID=UPI003F43CFC2
MALSDAFVIVGEWISEHYFTSQASKESFHTRVLSRRKEWEDHELSSRERFTAERGGLERRLGALSQAAEREELDGEAQEAAEALYDDVLTVLGYRTGEFALHRDGPVTVVSSAGIEGRAPLAIVRARPVGAVEDVVTKGKADDTFGTLAAPFVTAAGDEYHSAARALSALFVDAEGPDFALVLAGRWALVTERARWAEGRYLAVDLQTIAERNDAKRGGEIDRALTILEAGSLAPDADGAVWWSGVLAESVRHTVGVSEDLREGVRRSIEIIANDVVARRAIEGLDPLPMDQAQPLAVQSLRYLYRILFLLYAEASPELGVLPSGASEYDAGYSVDRLRDLALQELVTEQGRTGTHLYESLAVLSRLVDRGPREWPADDAESGAGLEFHPLRADLFAPAATNHIDRVKLSNEALQQVLKHLLLSKAKKSPKDKGGLGFISYAELGINQLGAVYEGLMSFTGFFAEEELYEVAPGGDASKGSWVVPVDRSDHLNEKDFVKREAPDSGELRSVRHRKGSFVYRLSGRERQQSASYYTPEVLTRFTVGQALEELLDQAGTKTTAEQILGISICEPALGSGAFALETVDQLARQYLERRQAELRERIDPEDFPHELQKVKAHIALHQVYGVDLNATAVELAEVSLWLATMTPGLQAPWFGLRLRRGNSLIGARRAAYPVEATKKKEWLIRVPEDMPLATLSAEMEEGRPGLSMSGMVHHFLLPAQGWGSGVEAPKEVRDLVPDAVKALKAWRNSVRKTPAKKHVDALGGMAQRVEQLWALTLRRLRIAEEQSGRDLDLWGRETLAVRRAVTREEIEASLADEDGPYRRLRRVMDAWSALWFWPLTETEVAPPTQVQWFDALAMILGRDTWGVNAMTTKGRPKNAGTTSFQVFDEGWGGLGDFEQRDRVFAGAAPIAEVLEAHPWLTVCEGVAKEQGFFHWELDFASVFARGGFDLQVGNPPWVKPDVDAVALLAEGDPWWQLVHKPTVEERTERRKETLKSEDIKALFVQAQADTVSVRAAVSATTMYPMLEGLRPDLYRVFMGQTWRNQSPRGVTALIHLDTHFTDDRAGSLRRIAYRRLRRHWQFINELRLFEIQDQKVYGVNVYGRERSVSFLNGAALYHPDTVVASLRHDGSGEEPGFKHEGKWDQRPHAARIQRVRVDDLVLWRDTTDPELADPEKTRMVSTVNSASTRVLAQLARSVRIGTVALEYSQGWNETTDGRSGRFTLSWGSASWDEVILQGPHLGVNNPYFKYPNPTMLHQQDWTLNDLESLSGDSLPVTSFEPKGDRIAYDRLYTRWGMDRESSARDFYRVSWRCMAANTGERTLIPALVPPGAAHVDGLFSAGKAGGDLRELAIFAGAASSLLLDFLIRSAPKSNIRSATFNRLPLIPLDHPLLPQLILRTLQLNCLTNAYADLWNKCWVEAFREDSPILGRDDTGTVVEPEWSAATPLRRAVDRRNAQVEVDALVALMLGVDVEDLCTVYRTQFAVLHGYDQGAYTYDANGRLVPNSVLSVWRKKGDRITEEERSEVHPGSGVEYVYKLPFATRDREDDFRVAYAEFERRLAAATAVPPVQD